MAITIKRANGTVTEIVSNDEVLEPFPHHVLTFADGTTIESPQKPRKYGYVNFTLNSNSEYFRGLWKSFFSDSEYLDNHELLELLEPVEIFPISSTRIRVRIDALSLVFFLSAERRKNLHRAISELRKYEKEKQFSEEPESKIPAQVEPLVEEKREPKVTRKESPSKRDNKILEMWIENYTYKNIGEEVSISPGRISNIITELRKKLGESKVPYHARGSVKK
jgi:hypothetical protein